jgi:hypothetical protein
VSKDRLTFDDDWVNILEASVSIGTPTPVPMHPQARVLGATSPPNGLPGIVYMASQTKGGAEQLRHFVAYQVGQTVRTDADLVYIGEANVPYQGSALPLGMPPPNAMRYQVFEVLKEE